MLPPELLPSGDQRQAMATHIEDLKSLLEQTPELSAEAETEVATAVSSILMVLPSQKTSEFAEAVRADAYLEALDDVPWWAVRGAIRAWHRHECGKDELGRPYDYKWAPGPGTLRAIAKLEVWRFLNRIQQLGKVLTAREFVDCASQLEKGRDAMRGLLVAGRGGFSGLSELTFDKAAELGRQKPEVSSAA